MLLTGIFFLEILIQLLLTHQKPSMFNIVYTFIYYRKFVCLHKFATVATNNSEIIKRAVSWLNKAFSNEYAEYCYSFILSLHL